MPCGRCVGGQRDDVCDEARTKCIARGYNLVDKSAWTAYEARDHFYVGGTEREIAESYGSGSSSGPEGTDVPEKHGFPLVFACQTEATGWYASQVRDGIVGFSMARTSLVNQMVFQGQLKYPRFCMCFEQKILMGDDMRNGGVVTLGGYNPHILDHPLVYVQNTERVPGTRYKVQVNGVYFRQGGGQSIVPDREGQAVVRLDFDAIRFNEKNGGTIVDSGVPLLVFDESIQQSFLTEWEKMVGSSFTLGKVMMTEDEVRALPTLIIQVKVSSFGWVEGWGSPSVRHNSCPTMLGRCALPLIQFVSSRSISIPGTRRRRQVLQPPIRPQHGRRSRSPKPVRRPYGRPGHPLHGIQPQHRDLPREDHSRQQARVLPGHQRHARTRLLLRSLEGSHRLRRVVQLPAQGGRRWRGRRESIIHPIRIPFPPPYLILLMVVVDLILLCPPG